MQTPIELLSEPVLLLDDHLVAETRGCVQTFHGAVKDPTSPVICATEPWEGRGPYTWGTRLLWNPDTDGYDLYYVGFRVEDNHYRWGLAVSGDGLTWRKPALDIESFLGAPARNMLTGGPHPDKAVRSVVRDPRPGCPPEERYKAIRFTYTGEFVSTSPDGRAWTEDAANPVWRVPSDIIHAMWDPRRQCFVSYYKVWEVTGETPDAASPSGFRPVVAHLPSFDHRLRADGLTELRGPLISFHPEEAATVEDGVLLLRAGNQGRDDGGGAPLTGAWHARRVQAWAESDDWRHWRHEQVVLRTDERDRPDANIQYLFVLPYGPYYLGFLTMHDERGYFEQQLAFSRDGRRWSRPWRGNFIGLGPEGTFDSGMVLAPTDPVLTDTQMLFYYGGFNTVHHAPMSAPWTSAIGRAILRRDGFASWDALPGQGGELLTQPLRADGAPLQVNADAGAGGLRVEVLDDTGHVVPGFARDRCVPLREDTARHRGCMAPVAWDPAPDGAALAGRSIQLRFELERARLFAFQFAP
ncbi:MAG: hypothetical protein ABIL09_10100 [Gemmatimonadota bacterium]